MEENASLWKYHESIDELRDKLLCSTIELESARNAAKEEMTKNNKTIKKLLQLLHIVSQERDEAIHQLQKLLQQYFLPSPSNILSPIITEVNSNIFPKPNQYLPKTHNYHSYTSLVPNFYDSSSSRTMIINHHDLAVIDDLVKGKPLPQKGRLLQSVIEAGPLLETLLVTGQLPLWQNPPQVLMQQPFRISSIPTKNIGTIPSFETTVNFDWGPRSCLNSRHPLSAGISSSDFMNNIQVPIGKRRRFQ